MRVFVTGATGFIGMAVVKDLIAAGHEAIGLSRSKQKASALAATGAKVVEGTVQDEALLKRCAGEADAVIHLAFNHDFSQFMANCADDRRVISALGAALAGSGRALVVTSGTAIARAAPGRPAREDDPTLPSSTNPRAASEEAARAAAETGVKVSVIRLPQVHDTRRQGLVTMAIAMFLEKRACAYLGDGAARWAAGHLSDVAPLYRLAMEKADPNATYHAVGEEGVAMKDIAETLGRRLKLPVRSLAPEEAAGFFGWLAMFAAHDMPASSALTQERLGWRPTGRGMLADLQELELDPA